MPSALCPVASAQWPVASGQCSVLSAQCPVSSVQCPVFSVQCSVFSAQCSVFKYSVQYLPTLVVVVVSILNIILMNNIFTPLETGAGTISDAFLKSCTWNELFAQDFSIM